MESFDSTYNLKDAVDVVYRLLEMPAVIFLQDLLEKFFV